MAFLFIIPVYIYVFLQLNCNKIDNYVNYSTLFENASYKKDVGTPLLL